MLWVVTFIFGAWIYTEFRIYIRVPVEERGLWKRQGFLEMKEHVTTIGLGLPPIYWYLWKNSGNADYDSARKGVTIHLAGGVLV